MSNILISTPSLGDVKTHYAFSLTQALKKDFKERNIISSCNFTSYSTICFARNTLCKMFLESDAEWLLFIDSDIGFTYENICQIYDKAVKGNVEVLSGCYYSYDEGNKRSFSVFSILEKDLEKDLNVAEWFGLGFCIISRSVLNKISLHTKTGEQFWFAESYSEENGYVGEDVFFLNLLKKNDIKIYIDPSIELGHSKNVIF